VVGNGVIHIDDLAVEVTVRRISRMNLGVHPPDGQVRLSVPLRTSERALRRFVRENRVWIEQHRVRIAEEERSAALRPTPRRPRGVHGEVWWRFGQALRLEVEPGVGRPRVEMRPDRRLRVRVPDPSDAPAVLAALDRWERREMRDVAESLLSHWCARIGVQHQFLGLRRMTTRWGTCVPSKGRIWLNVALFPRHPALLEYVIVHEAVHLQEGSHGPRFRALMDTHLPDWQERRAHLDLTTSAPYVVPVHYGPR
jgi:predicted metal-dependent hydrolase